MAVDCQLCAVHAILLCQHHSFQCWNLRRQNVGSLPVQEDIPGPAHAHAHTWGFAIPRSLGGDAVRVAPPGLHSGVFFLEPECPWEVLESAR